ncbi:MAG: hypothetical protein AB8G96_09030 [Phycisphaerales bacterium]
MKRRLLGAGTVAAAALITLPASAGLVMIDDFSSGAFSSSITSGSDVTQQAGSMIGGQRDVGLEVLDNPFNQNFEVALGGGGLGLSFSAGVGLAGQLGLDYDGSTDVEDGSLPFEVGEGLNLDLSGLTDIQFGFLAADLDFEVLVILQQVENGAVTQTSQASLAVNASGSPFNATIALSEFDGALLNDVDRIGVLFNFNEAGDPASSLDFLLTEISVVPAPSALAAFGLLGLAAGRRRRG